jgi:hypothetical protein
MDNSRDLPTLFAEAEQAAVAGDYVAAERLLREAADQQEASLGPFHPDLANTLNNLGVVYETIDRPADAERCYRRAYSIALASLEPDHPFVSTSEKNFRDFCEARGIPLELPKPLPERTRGPTKPARASACTGATTLAAGCTVFGAANGSCCLCSCRAAATCTCPAATISDGSGRPCGCRRAGRSGALVRGESYG